MGAPRANRLAGGLAMAAMATAVFALLPGGGGCELVVSDALPSFTCVPDAADSCPTDSVCVPSTHQCVSRSGTCVPGAPTGCPAGMRCDAESLRCTKGATVAGDASGADAQPPMTPDSAPDAPGVLVMDGPTEDAPITPDASPLDSTADAPNACRGITCSCRGGGDCDSGICAGQVTLPAAVYTAIGTSVCTQPCCTSADCPGGTVCFGTGGGGNYCIAPHWIGRSGEMGEGPGGTSCTGDGDCRSGLCSMNTCADTCCSSSTTNQGSECASATVCRFAAFPGSNSLDTHETAWCGAEIGSMAGGSICAVDTTCQSGKCGSFGRCEAVCRNTGDCGGGGLACSYGLAPTLPTNKDIVAGCVTATGTTANGGTCSSNADCQSAFCDGSHCTDVCATDADCKSGLHCRPVVVQVQGSYSVLSCES